jgi:hypothetical protein
MGLTNGIVLHPYYKLAYIKLAWGGAEEQDKERAAGNQQAKNWQDEAQKVLEIEVFIIYIQVTNNHLSLTIFRWKSIGRTARKDRLLREALQHTRMPVFCPSLIVIDGRSWEMKKTVDGKLSYGGTSSTCLQM